MKEEKEFIRKLLIERRNELTVDEINDKSKKIIQRLIETRQYKNSKIIMAFMNTKNEVRTIELIESATAGGKTVCLPLVLKDKKEMDIFKVENLDTDVRIGSYGIYEPIPREAEKIDSREIQMIIVPGVGFDVKKNRIGFGGGYYDRFLSQLSPKVFKIALAYDFQILDEIPVNNLDIKMDMIITEKKVLE